MFLHVSIVKFDGDSNLRSDLVIGEVTEVVVGLIPFNYVCCFVGACELIMTEYSVKIQLVFEK